MCDSQSTLEHEGQLRKSRTPLPLKAMAVVSLIQMSEALTATVVSPFMPELVRGLGIADGDEKRVGYFVGIIQSLFFCGEFLTVWHWARASDRFGRRPILLLGPLGLAIATTLLGFSHTLFNLALLRFCQGIFNGGIGVSKTVVVELTDSTNLAAAISISPLMWGLGKTIGPLVGGILSNPSSKYASLDTAFFRENPYFLPCATTGVAATLIFIFAYFYLPETATTLRLDDKPTETTETSSLLISSNAEDYGTQARPATPPLKTETSLRSVFQPNLIVCYAVVSLFSFISMSFDVLTPLMYSTSIPLGGLGMNPQRIGIIIASFGLSGGLLQLFVFSRLITWVGPRKVVIISHVAFGLAILAFPLVSILAKRADGLDAKVIVLIAIQQSLSLMGYPTWASVQILTVNASPSKKALASVNSVCQAISVLVRGLAPSLSSSLFAISLQSHVLGGYMVYYALLGIIVMSLTVALRLPRPVQKI